MFIFRVLPSFTAVIFVLAQTVIFNLFFLTPLYAQTPSPDEMWQIILEQQEAIEELKSRLSKAEQGVEESISAIEVTADAMDAATKSNVARQTSIGGYGELHYNNLNDGALSDGADDVNKIDFHRYVLFVGHEYNDRIRFFSELEVEHSLAGDGKPGEVELEQAWIEMDLNDSNSVRAGLDILPIGIINPTHEPNTFYGVERNKIESEIIPATWWEAGGGLMGELVPGVNYDLVFHSGLAVPTSGGNAFRPRSGRKKVASATDLGFATTGRIRYTAVPGLEVGISGQYQSDITGTKDVYDISATLMEGHVVYQSSEGFGFRALYARWDLGNDTGLNPADVNADSLQGWYIEPSYRFNMGQENEIGVFGRYSNWDQRNQISGAHKFEDFEKITVGLNYWPHENVVLKFDTQWEDSSKTVDRLLDGINIGIGYQF